MINIRSLIIEAGNIRDELVTLNKVRSTMEKLNKVLHYDHYVDPSYPSEYRKTSICIKAEDVHLIYELQSLLKEE